MGFGLVGGGIFNLGRDFMVAVVEVAVDKFKLVVKAFLRLVWACLNERMCFLWHLSLMLVEGKMSNINRRLSWMVMLADFLRLLLFLDDGHLQKVTSVQV